MQEKFMARAIEIARESVDTRGPCRMALSS